jgi:hypothetical protein
MDDSGSTVPPSGTFNQVSAGGWHSCGIRSDGTLACWGNSDYGQLNNIPTGTFSQISTNYNHTCGIKSDGTLACWGDNSWGQLNNIPSGTFSQINAAGGYTCGIKSDGTLACWGRNLYGEATPLSGTFSQVSAGTWHACGLKNDGTLACWGMDDSGSTVPPSGTFSQVSAGSNRTCGVRTDGTLTCWGYEAYGEAPILSLTPSSLVGGVIGNAYSQSLSLTTAVYTPPLPQIFTLTAGNLPPGLSLSAAGLLSGTPTTGGTSSFTLRGEDANGFTASQNYTLTIGTPDTTPPVITPSVSGTLGNNGWYKSTVNLTWSVVDSESSVTTQVGCGPQTIATDTTEVTFTCQATSTGGTTSQSVTLKRDATAPVLSPTVSPNPVLLNGAATASPAGSDTTSGLAAASCNPATTSSAGSFTVTCTATDNAGNVANASANYVVRYQFLGFLSPLPGASYRPGATIRVKFRLADASGTPIADAAAQGLVTACRVKIGLDTAAGCASYDARNDLFQLDVKVPKSASAGTHQIVMQVLASDNTVVNTATTAVVIR